MKKLKKIMCILIFMTLMILMFSIKSNASSSDLYLNNLNFDAIVNMDGSMDVTETWDINIEDTNTLFKTFKLDDSRFKSIKNVKVEEINSYGNEKEFNEIHEEMYHVTKNCYYGLINSDGNFEIAWGVGLDSGSDTRTYKISYTVEDAIKNCNGFSELYWQFVGEDFEINAKNITGTISLPGEADKKSNIKVWGHTEDLNGDINVASKDTVKFQINQFNSGKYVEVRVAIPNEIEIESGRVNKKITLENIINEETIWAKEANERRERKIAINNTVIVALSLIAISLCIWLVNKIVKNRKIYNELPKKFKPTQDIVYYRELPNNNSTPAEALRILKNGINDYVSDDIGKIFSATLLDLSLKGFIEFESSDSKKITIILKNTDFTSIKDKEDELTIYKFLKLACGTDNQIDVKDLEKYIKNHTSDVVKLKSKLEISTKSETIKDGYIDKNNKDLTEKNIGAMVGYIVILLFTSIVNVMTLIGIKGLASTTIIWSLIISTIFFGVISIINIIMKGKILSKINVYTQKGIDEQNMWKGLKKFMEEFSMLDKREVPELAIWEKYLVYATVFGIADKVIKQLKIVYPNFDEVGNMNTGVYMGLMVNTNFSSSFSNSISSAMSSSYSSGSGGGGGFSGGGGRRPEAAVAEEVDNTFFFII